MRHSLECREMSFGNRLECFFFVLYLRVGRLNKKRSMASGLSRSTVTMNRCMKIARPKVLCQMLTSLPSVILLKSTSKNLL